MTLALSIVPLRIAIGRLFLTIDGLGFHAGWAGRWECAWTPGMGWTHGPVPPMPRRDAAGA